MYFVTGNKNKFIEALKVFPDLKQLDIELTEIQSLDSRVVIAAKLKEAHIHHPDELVVEDVSVEIEGLGNLPGTLIKWFLKSMSLEQIADLANKSGNPKAIARAVLGYGRPGEEPIFIEEVMNGTIVAPKGDRGFGWDPIFLVDGETKTQAERKADEVISMRGAAFLKLKANLGR
jgi:XTP/dITP diphosphohydrolase